MQVKRFLPFLSGNRSCIGMSLAQLNYTTAAATLLARFSFRLAEDVSAASVVFLLHGLYQCSEKLDNVTICCHLTQAESTTYSLTLEAFSLRQDPDRPLLIVKRIALLQLCNVSSKLSPVSIYDA